LNVRQNRLEIHLGRQILREKRSGPIAKDDLSKQPDGQFWPRIEMSRLFVLSELQPFLYIGLCRIEMRPGSAKLKA